MILRMEVLIVVFLGKEVGPNLLLLIGFLVYLRRIATKLWAEHLVDMVDPEVSEV